MTHSQLSHGDGASMQGRLIDLLDRLTSSAAVTIGPETEIFAMSLFDSLALVELVMWVEEEIGNGVDLSDVDFKTEWRTVHDLVSFIQRNSATDRTGGGA